MLVGKWNYSTKTQTLVDSANLNQVTVEAHQLILKEGSIISENSLAPNKASVQLKLRNLDTQLSMKKTNFEYLQLLIYYYDF